MENSEHISSFLKFLKDIQTDYNIALETEKEADRETQDILHRLELGNDSYHDMAQMSKIIKSVRLERRKAKDAKTEAEPVMRWLKESPQTVRVLEQLLGEVRKAEKYNSNRHYTNKTDILDGIGDKAGINTK
ncbi:MAG: hypothetical protein K2O92_07250 [Lachnospiraceae bacterium]|nr:hypothetical protein [Lachnospiraceae bacterium]